MNRRHFQQLAAIRVDDAQALLVARRYSGAYYLAGYAVQCALKACIAKQTRRYDFPPDPRTVQRFYSHSLDGLIDSAGLRSDLMIELRTDSTFRDYWETTAEWSEQSRYQQYSRHHAESLLAAIGDNAHGVLRWVQQYW